MSASRTAQVGAAVTTAGAVIALRGAANQPTRRVMMVPAAGALVTVAVFVLAGGTVGPIERLFERSAGASDSSFVDIVVNRPPYGPTAVDMLRDYPFTGVGLGSYQQLAPDYWRRQANDSLP